MFKSNKPKIVKIAECNTFNTNNLLKYATNMEQIYKIVKIAECNTFNTDALLINF